MKNSKMFVGVSWVAIALVATFLGKDFVLRVVEALQVLSSLPAH